MAPGTLQLYTMAPVATYSDVQRDTGTKHARYIQVWSDSQRRPEETIMFHVHLDRSHYLSALPLDYEAP